MNNILLICLIAHIVTLYLFKNSKVSNDKKILLFMILGQIICFYGYYSKNNKIIELSHIIFFISIILGSLFFKEKYNKLYVLIVLIATVISRIMFNDCLFSIVNKNTKLINLNLPHGLIYNVLLIVIIYRVLTN
tara:strand:- start:6 stop:407 length:402 start_codon:yes stop_codon:yes gene_type:complete